MIKIDYKSWLEEFPLTPVGKEVLKDYPNITCTNNPFPSIIVACNRYGLSPREMVSDMLMPRRLAVGEYSIVPFYYMNILQSSNPSKVIDLGCGSNMFKKYYSNIVGIDAVHPSADVLEMYNEQFVKDHEGEYESVISINMTQAWMPDGSLVNYGNLSEALYQFTKILKVGGQAALCISVWALNRFTPREWYDANNCNPYEVVNLTKHTIEAITSVPNINITHLDVDLDLLYNNVGHDGEIRIVFTKIDK